MKALHFFTDGELVRYTLEVYDGYTLGLDEGTDMGHSEGFMDYSYESNWEVSFIGDSLESDYVTSLGFFGGGSYQYHYGIIDHTELGVILGSNVGPMLHSNDGIKHRLYWL